MDKNEEIIYENLSDGILLVELDGKIRLVNQSVAEILGMGGAELKGKKLVRLMMEHEGNDEFFQCILDAVYSKQKSSDIVRYHLGSEEKRLRVVSSLLPPGGGGMEKGGLAVLLSDLTKIITLSEKNEELNRRLSGFIDRFVQVMIGAVEARTPYNANHTKNMVRYGTRFLDWWCIQPGQSFPEEMRTPVLASIWLHDIG
ncbi:MAG: PAS domain S-box protein, partial [Lachnospiraceae bacterium]|nr:PAS domain S-box protein [Lachnospiraceae bacterium]